ncbi:Werner Syndrome-like exonuclease isoform X2 [Rhodamnia argentea]|uniref:3'-5' exonuclease n=1 Tax=Rhodamnia argentea TaxID=178133 RepID=A0ABM3HS38_9MYRT|nr:Werner Syndrome-like exonuclease isoform X2 [Rhodamnia argentea]
MKIASADGDTPTIVANARSIGAESVPGWDQPFTDQELDDIEAAVTTAISKKRRPFSGTGNDDDEDERPGGPRRRLPGSFSLQHSMRIKLPVMIFRGRITYNRSATGVERAAAQLLSKIDAMKGVMDQVIIGFDIEYRPTFQRGVPPRKTAVMQICGDNDHCHVMHVIRSGIPPSLKLILEDTAVLKVGAGIAGDARKVLKDYNVSVNGFQDLSELANQKLALPRNRWGLASLSELEKSMKIRCGNWEAFFLSEEQLLYAATDAFVSWHLYQVLKSLPDARRNNIENNEEKLTVALP